MQFNMFNRKVSKALLCLALLLTTFAAQAQTEITSLDQITNEDGNY